MKEQDCYIPTKNKEVKIVARQWNEERAAWLNPIKLEKQSKIILTRKELEERIKDAMNFAWAIASEKKTNPFEIRKEYINSLFK